MSTFGSSPEDMAPRADLGAGLVFSSIQVAAPRARLAIRTGRRVGAVALLA